MNKTLKTGLYYDIWRNIASLPVYYVRKKIYKIFIDLMNPNKDSLILDVGTIGDQVNKRDNFFENLYPWSHRITAVGLDDCKFLEKKYPGLKFIQADGKNLPFKNNSFDIAFSSATIEHVGNTENQKKFISELLRVGVRVFITTPDRYFPIEVHSGIPLLNFLPKKIYRKILKKIGMDYFANEDNFNSLNKKEFKNLFPKNRVKIIKKFGVLIAISK